MRATGATVPALVFDLPLLTLCLSQARDHHHGFDREAEVRLVRRCCAELLLRSARLSIDAFCRHNSIHDYLRGLGADYAKSAETFREDAGLGEVAALGAIAACLHPRCRVLT